MKTHLIKLIPIGLFLVFISSIGKSQDIHLSHIHASPTVLNPAMNGLFNGQARMTANARSQWNAVTKGYKTAVASTDIKLAMVNKNDIISGGLQLYSDKAGDLNLTKVSVSMALSYLKSFDKRGRNFLSFGLQNSFVQNHVDYTKIVTFDEIYALQQGAVQNKINYWDVNAGVGWFFKPNRYDAFYVGLSAFHLNKPGVGFKNAEYSENATTLYRRINLHGGATIRMNKSFTIKPSFLFMDQGPHQEITLGSFLRYKTYRRGLHKKPLYFVYVGAWLRSYMEKDIAGIDALVASVKYEYRQLSLTLSYDINLSSYIPASRGRGGLEFSIVRVFDWPRSRKKNSKVKCPIM